MRDDLELFIKQLKAENMISVGINSDYAKQNGYEDIHDALAGITYHDQEYIDAVKRKELVSHTSRYIHRLEEIAYKHSYAGKMEQFRLEHSEAIAELRKQTWSYDFDDLVQLALGLEHVGGHDNHDDDMIIIIDGVRCYYDDEEDKEDMRQMVMDYLDITYEERD